MGKPITKKKKNAEKYSKGEIFYKKTARVCKEIFEGVLKEYAKGLFWRNPQKKCLNNFQRNIPAIFQIHCQENYSKKLEGILKEIAQGFSKGIFERIMKDLSKNFLKTFPKKISRELFKLIFIIERVSKAIVGEASKSVDWELLYDVIHEEIFETSSKIIVRRQSQRNNRKNHLNHYQPETCRNWSINSLKNCRKSKKYALKTSKRFTKYCIFLVFF